MNFTSNFASDERHPVHVSVALKQQSRSRKYQRTTAGETSPSRSEFDIIAGTESSICADKFYTQKTHATGRHDRERSQDSGPSS